MKHYLVIPLAGLGNRFAREGFILPKQMLPVGESTTFDYSMGSIKLDDFEIVFVIRKEQSKAGLADFIKSKIHQEIKIITIDRLTRGSVETVLESELVVPPDSKLTIFTMDVAFSNLYTASTFQETASGGVLTFKSNSLNYSYAKVKSDVV